jgi:hypothetical protein
MAGLPSSFVAVVKIAGINPYVDVPARVTSELKQRGKAVVLIKVSRRGAKKVARGTRMARDAARLKRVARLAPGGWFRTTVVPAGGRHRLYLDTWMRDAAAVGIGDRVRISLKPDRRPRDLAAPRILQQALKTNSTVMIAWMALSPSRRREILSYLNFLKTPAALERNVRKVVTQLAGRPSASSS